MPILLVIEATLFSEKKARVELETSRGLAYPVCEKYKGIWATYFFRRQSVLESHG